MDPSVAVRVRRHHNLSDCDSSIRGIPLEYTYLRHPVDPPRPARDGLEWVWFPEGYWAERDVVGRAPQRRPQPAERSRWWNKGSSDKQSPTSSQQAMHDNTNSPTSDVPEIKIGSLRTGVAPSEISPGSSKSSNQTIKTHNASSESPFSFRFMTHTQVSTDSTGVSPDMDVIGEQLGLFHRAKKNIQSRLLNKPNLSRDVR